MENYYIIEDNNINEETELNVSKKITLKTVLKKIIKTLFILMFLLLFLSIIYFSFVATNFGKFLITNKTLNHEQNLAKTQAIEISQRIAEESIVLLKNDNNILPLTTNNSVYKNIETINNINLFGVKSYTYSYMGNYANKNQETLLTIEEALIKNGFNINKDIKNLYLNYNFNNSLSTEPMDKKPVAKIETYKELPISSFNDKTINIDGTTLNEKAQIFSDTALLVLGRELQTDSPIDVETLNLTEEEKNLLDYITENFTQVILVINSSAPLELNFLKDYTNIDAILYMDYLGEEGGIALSKILKGDINPSGRLTDIVLYDTLNFTTSKTADNITYQNYNEGIYVGYKYFETRYTTDASFDYNNIVTYPFGYGKSYTTFSQELKTYEKDIYGNVNIDIEVTNKGNYAGKEVVQLYYSPPYQGNIEKASTNLLAFSKTSTLSPGEKEIVSLSFHIEDMASYDYKNSKSFVLEAGDYNITLNRDSHNRITTIGCVNISDSIVLNEYTQSAFVDTTIEYKELTQDGSIPETIVDDSYLKVKNKSSNDFLYSNNLSEDILPLQYNITYDKTILLSDLKDIDYENKLWDTFISQLTLEELCAIVDTGFYEIKGIDRLGIPTTVYGNNSQGLTSDFNSGIITGIDITGTFYPSNSSISKTWNTSLAYNYGKTISNEAKSLGYNGFYGLNLNIHRTPLDENYFNSFSEDAFLTGSFGTNILKGSNTNNATVFIDNYPLNYDDNYVIVNEQALREIYLKPFEMAVKSGETSALKVSDTQLFNSNSELQMAILREEWNYNGIVAMNPTTNIQNMLYYGYDLYLNYPFPMNEKTNLYSYTKSLDNNNALLSDLQRATKNILFTLSKNLDH
ncbi:MAG: glycoside hydrolase family 3 C-terminal domain-containing protein [Lachnospirales bacterium]